MEINQLVLTLSYGDAIGNSALNLKKVLNDAGMKSEIYAQNIHPKLLDRVKHVSDMPYNQPLLYHMSIGCDLSYKIPEFTSKKIMIYHNITPGHYFQKYNTYLETLCAHGRNQLMYLQPYIDLALGDSEFNRLELEWMGYQNTRVAPIIIDFDNYNHPVDEAVVQEIRHTKRGSDILFVGRMVPNKKIEDIIQVFSCYQKHLDPNARLYLVGFHVFEEYITELHQLIALLQVRDVHFIGHVKFDQLLAYYHTADLFLCMSEHEGFCVPLLEAMHFGLPIVALDRTAISETLGAGGILVSTKDYLSIAIQMFSLLHNEPLRASLKLGQQAQLQYYAKANTEQRFLELLNEAF